MLPLQFNNCTGFTQSRQPCLVCKSIRQTTRPAVDTPGLCSGEVRCLVILTGGQIHSYTLQASPILPPQQSQEHRQTVRRPAGSSAGMLRWESHANERVVCLVQRVLLMLLCVQPSKQKSTLWAKVSIKDAKKLSAMAMSVCSRAAVRCHFDCR